MNKKNDFFVTCYGNKFGDVYRIWMTKNQITNIDLARAKSEAAINKFMV